MVDQADVCLFAHICGFDACVSVRFDGRAVTRMRRNGKFGEPTTTEQDCMDGRDWIDQSQSKRRRQTWWKIQALWTVGSNPERWDSQDSCLDLLDEEAAIPIAICPGTFFSGGKERREREKDGA